MRTRPVFTCFSQIWPKKDRRFLQPAILKCITFASQTLKPLQLQRFRGNNLTKPLPDTLYQVGVYAMWLGLLLDTIETL